MVLIALMAPMLSHANTLKYICVIDSKEKFDVQDSQFAIIYSNDYEVVYPARSWCMSHLNMLTCEFEFDGYEYSLEVDVARAYTPTFQRAGSVTKSGWIKKKTLPVSCYLRD